MAQDDDIRISMNLYSGDSCTFNIIIGREMKYTFFLNFMNTMTYSVPVPGRRAIYPDDEPEEEHGVNLDVPDWYWWIRADGITMSCGSNMNSGPILTCIENEFTRHPYIEIRISVNLARRLRAALDRAVAQMPREFTREQWTTTREEQVRFEAVVLTYSVRSIKCTVVDKYRNQEQEE